MKHWKYVLLFALTLGVFVACDDDDDDDKTSPATEIEKTYTGTLSITLPEQEPIPQAGKEMILKADGKKIDVSLENFSFGEISLGTIAVKGLTVTKSGSVYTLTENTQSITVTLPVGETNLPVPVSAKTSGKVEEGKLTLNIEITGLAELLGIAKVEVTFASN